MLVHKGNGRRYHKAQEYCSIYIDHELKFDFRIIYSYGFQKFKTKLADKETKEKD